MLTTIGTLDPPLGNARLQASKLIAAVLATNSDTINAELANLGTLRVLWVCIIIIWRYVKCLNDQKKILVFFERQIIHFVKWIFS